jgi:hypothetical protein
MDHKSHRAEVCLALLVQSRQKGREAGKEAMGVGGWQSLSGNGKIDEEESQSACSL